MTSAARMAMLALVVAIPAQAQDAAQDRVQIDTNLICDTQKQVERFVALFDRDADSAEAAIAMVNAENNSPDACVIATTAYRPMAQVATVTKADMTFDVMRIEVSGVYTVSGMERSEPTEFFTLFPREGDAGTVGQR